MKRVTEHYAEFSAPGSFMANQWTTPVVLGQSIEWPDTAYSYQLWKRVDVHDGDDVFQGKPEKVGKLVYHPDSMITTLEQVELGDSPDHGPALISNMRRNHWDAVIWTRWGNWPQPWDAEQMEIAA